MNLSKLHVVVVEDNAFKRREIQKALKENGISGINTVGDQEKCGKEFTVMRTAQRSRV